MKQTYIKAREEQRPSNNAGIRQNQRRKNTNVHAIAPKRSQISYKSLRNIDKKSSVYSSTTVLRKFLVGKSTSSRLLDSHKAQVNRAIGLISNKRSKGIATGRAREIAENTAANLQKRRSNWNPEKSENGGRIRSTTAKQWRSVGTSDRWARGRSLMVPSVA